MTQLNIGLLLCDDIDEADRPTYGSYTEMFRAALHGADDGDGADLSLTPINCYLGEMPAADAMDEYDAFVISGSRCAVYDAADWITRLQDFVRECHARRKKIIGICFGHQLIAQALGGETRKAEVGWGIGIHRTRITAPQTWMALTDDACAGVPSGNGRELQHYNLIVVHQDQVIKPPPKFRVIAENDFCPVSMMVGDATLGIQGHPEFNRAFCESRILARRESLGEEVVKQSLASLEQMALDSNRVLRWILRFIQHA